MARLILIVFISLILQPVNAGQAVRAFEFEEIGCDMDLNQRNDLIQKIRDAFLREFLNREFATREMNREVIRLAIESHSNQNFRFLLKENAVLKVLNTINDKDLVTALTNYHNYLYLQELNRLLPDVKFKTYWDFKGLLIALPEPCPADLNAKLDKVMAEADRRFYESAVLSQIVRRGDLGNVMFKSSVAHSDVMAVWIAHLARKMGQNFISGDNPEILETLLGELKDFQALHAKLIKRFNGKSILDREGLALAAFAAARKFSDPKDLRRELRTSFKGVGITSDDVADIQAYAELANSFSPNLLIEERGGISIKPGGFGSVAIDFLGLGAENLRATANALVGAQDLHQAAALARAAERKVTAEFERKKKLVSEEIERHASEMLEDPLPANNNGPIVEINLSGDDGYIRLLRKLKPGYELTFLSLLSDIFEGPYLRMSFITEKMKTKDISAAIGHGENIEKTFRKLIRERMGTFADSMQVGLLIPDAGADREVFLFLNFYWTSMPGLTLSRSFSEAEKDKIRTAFADAVAIVQNDIANIRYRANPTVYGRHLRIHARSFFMPR